MAKISAELIDVMGDDLRVVNAARVSFDKESLWAFGDEGLILGLKDEKLINYLAKHKHWTPFSHPMITIRETVPIFVARQRFKHMVGFTYNEVSRRYVDSPPEFYIPDEWRSRPEGSVKQGSGESVITELGDDAFGYGAIHDAYSNHLHRCVDIYDGMITAGVAPEMARMVLPQSMMTSYYVTGSLYAFANAYRQRIDPHSQKEIQDLATQWDAIIRPLFPVSWRALTS